jgi:hypothetical protein
MENPWAMACPHGKQIGTTADWHNLIVPRTAASAVGISLQKRGASFAARKIFIRLLIEKRHMMQYYSP